MATSSLGKSSRWQLVKKSVVITSSVLSRQLHFIILLSAMFQDPGELNVVKHSILDGSFSVHLIHVIICESIPDGSEQFSQFVFMKDTQIAVVKASKRILYHIFRISTL